MARSLLCAAGGALLTTANITSYTNISGRPLTLDQNESLYEIVFRTAGTFSNFYCRLTTNTITIASTLQLRKNTATNCAEVISLTGSTTGAFEDTTHTDAVTAGDRFVAKFIPGAATNTITFNAISIIFDAASTSCISKFAGGRSSTTADSTVAYTCISGGAPFFASVETNMKVRMRKAGTLKNAHVYVSANARTSATTMKSRKNAADGTIALSIGATTTGIVEDTSHSDTVASGEDWDWAFTAGAGAAQNITVDTCSAEFETTTNYGNLPDCKWTTVAIPDASTGFTSVFGTLENNGTEASTQVKARVGFVLSELICLVTANDISSASTVDLRKNGSSTSMPTLSVTGNTTGLFNDSSTLITLATTDLINYRMVAPSVSGSHNLTLVWISSYTKDTVFNRAISATATSVSESVARVASKPRDISATATVITDSVARVKTAGAVQRSASETTTIDASVVRLASKFRAASETTVISDAIARLASKFRTISATATTISDSAARVRTVPRTISATATVISDAVARLASKFRAPSTETTTVSASVARLREAPRTISATATVISDTVVRLASKFRTASETTTVSASVARLRTVPRTISATATVISDSVVRLASKFRSLSETTVISDAVDRVREVLRTISATATTISDAVTRLASKFRSLSETTVISDDIARLRTVLRTISATATVITDSVVRLASKFRTLSETTVISDAVSRLASKFRTLSETTTISAAVARIRNVPRAISATATTISASIARLRQVNRLAGEYIYDELSSNYDVTTVDTLSPNSKWRHVYHGSNPQNGSELGQTGVRVPSGNAFPHVLYEYPYTTVNTDGGSSASLILTETPYFFDFDVTFSARTVAQKKSSPNAWETFWFMFRYNEADGDIFHHYYIALKSNGRIEFGKKDNTVSAEEQYYILGVLPTFTFTLGNWNKIRVRAIGNHFTMWLDDVQKFDVVDDGSGGAQVDAPNTPAAPSNELYSGKFGFYNEDAEVEISSMTIAVPEAVVISSSVARLKIKPRSISETAVTLSDSVVRLASKFRSISETVIISDSVVRLASKFRSITATATVISDSVVRLASKFRSISNTVIVSDSVSRLAEKFRSITATATVISDDVSKQRDVPRPISNTVIISDSIIRLASKFRSITATATVISDSVDRLRDVPRAISNTVVISDSIVRLAQKFRSISNSISVSDSVVGFNGIIRSLSETTVVTDSVARLASKFRSILNTVIITDDVSGNVDNGTVTRDISESVSVSSAISKAAQHFRSISQSVSVLDYLVRMMYGIGKSGSHMRLRFM